jgi:hypothetical protein
MRRFLRARKLLKRAAIGLGAAVAVFVVLAIVFAVHCSTTRGGFQPSESSRAVHDITGYARPEDGSFLSYAEWYIVWSYQEKAAWQRAHLPSGFPYFAAIGQYWSGYCCSYSVVRGRYPFNFADHLMLSVIGSSFTLEYALKGMYENTLGRFSEWTARHELTDDDRYAAEVAREYGQFVADRPFYEFPFFHVFGGLWSETRLFGPHAFRKWERKAWLSLDYAVEGIYCGLIELASHAVYGIEDDFTYAIVERMAQKPEMMRLPRYQKFTAAACRLLASGARFDEVAGNRQIMVTAVVPSDWRSPFSKGEVLFATGILTNPAFKRLAIRSRVEDLGEIAAAIPIEHIYDY